MVDPGAGRRDGGHVGLGREARAAGKQGVALLLALEGAAARGRIALREVERVAGDLEAGLLKLATQFVGAALQIGGCGGIVEGQASGQLAVLADLKADIDTAQIFGRQHHVEPGRTALELAGHLRGELGGGLDGGARQGGRTLSIAGRGGLLRRLSIGRRVVRNRRIRRRCIGRGDRVGCGLGYLSGWRRRLGGDFHPGAGRGGVLGRSRLARRNGGVASLVHRHMEIAAQGRGGLKRGRRLRRIDWSRLCRLIGCVGRFGCRRRRSFSGRSDDAGRGDEGRLGHRRRDGDLDLGGRDLSGRKGLSDRRRCGRLVGVGDSGLDRAGRSVERGRRRRRRVGRTRRCFAHDRNGRLGRDCRLRTVGRRRLRRCNRGLGGLDFSRLRHGGRRGRRFGRQDFREFQKDCLSGCGRQGGLRFKVLVGRRRRCLGRRISCRAGSRGDRRRQRLGRSESD